MPRDDVVGEFGPDRRQLLEARGESHGDLGGACRRVRVGAVRAGRPHRELEPQRALLAEAHAERARRLAVEERVAVHLRVVLHEIAGAVGAERFLVGNGREGETPFEAVLDPRQIDVGPDRRRGAAFHVGGAAAVDFPIDELAAPGVLRPSEAVVGNGKHVDVAIEHKMLAGLAGREGRDDVRHLGVGRDDAIVESARSELAGDEVGCRARVARWVGAPAAHEGSQECDQRVAILVDPDLQLLAITRRHVPSPMPWRTYALAGRAAFVAGSRLLGLAIAAGAASSRGAGSISGSAASRWPRSSDRSRRAAR